MKPVFVRLMLLYLFDLDAVECSRNVTHHRGIEDISTTYRMIHVVFKTFKYPETFASEFTLKF